MLDGAPIIAVLTVQSGNAKTGAMLQTWIMRADVRPNEAIRSGDDSSVCGDCPQRPALGGDCYVKVFQGPLSVYKAFHRGNYPAATDADWEALRADERPVRVGSYGDPAAVPFSVWHRLLCNRPAGHTGYTHQWRSPVAAPLRPYLMASADSEADRVDAEQLGWRTFRVLREDSLTGPAPLEFRCPSDPALDTHIPCSKCKACDGFDADRPRKGSPYIVVHGFRAGNARKRVASRLAVLS
jgi:hypothetical protein